MTQSDNQVEKETYTPIDIKVLAKQVIPKYAKFIPFFVYKRLEKILHIKELNKAFSEHFNDSGKEFLNAVEKEILKNTIVFDGYGENVLKENAGKKILFAGNHPYGGPEAMALMNYLIDLYPDIKLVTQSFLHFIKPLQNFCVYNKNNVRSLKEHIDNKASLLIYPAGKCSRILSTKEVFDNMWYSSFVKIAKKNNMDIVIVYTDGQLSRRFFRWQKLQGKTEIGTLFLVDEMFKMATKPLRMVFSQPIKASVLTDNLSNEEWALRLRQYCFSLRENPFSEFDPKLENRLPEN